MIRECDAVSFFTGTVPDAATQTGATADADRVNETPAKQRDAVPEAVPDAVRDTPQPAAASAAPENEEKMSIDLPIVGEQSFLTLAVVGAMVVFVAYMGTSILLRASVFRLSFSLPPFVFPSLNHHHHHLLLLLLHHHLLLLDLFFHLCSPSVLPLFVACLSHVFHATESPR